MTDVSSLLKILLQSIETNEKIEPYHPLVNGFGNFFRQFRKKKWHNIIRGVKIWLPEVV